MGVERRAASSTAQRSARREPAEPFSPTTMAGTRWLVMLCVDVRCDGLYLGGCSPAAGVLATSPSAGKADESPCPVGCSHEVLSPLGCRGSAQQRSSVCHDFQYGAARRVHFRGPGWSATVTSPARRRTTRSRFSRNGYCVHCGSAGCCGQFGDLVGARGGTTTSSVHAISGKEVRLVGSVVLVGLVIGRSRRRRG
jgi:hypothetical protein